MNYVDVALMELLYANASPQMQVQFHEIATHLIEHHGGMHQPNLPATIYHSALNLQVQGFVVILNDHKNINHYTLCATRKGQAHYDGILKEMK